MEKIYTLGYQGKSLDEFIHLLTSNDINLLVDVRSKPVSSIPGFNQRELKEKLSKKSILYKHMPDMGGMIHDDYHETMKSENWNKSYSDLKSLAVKGPTAIMCMEKDLMRCHRRFIMEKLQKDGWSVVHIGRGVSWKEKRLDDFFHR